MKLQPWCIAFLLLAACASGNGPARTGGEFAAEDIAPDAVHTEPPKELPGRELTVNETQRAALLVNNLATAAGEGEREQALQALIKLGPRYLEFLRAILDDNIALDLMWVVRRIENESSASASPSPLPLPPVAAEPEPAPESAGPRRPPPIYSDLPGEFDREQVERFLGARLKEARRLLDSASIEAATRIAEAALTLLPDTRYKPEFDKVLRDARRQSQAELLIAGTMQLAPENVQYALREKGANFAQPLVIRCYLRNVSAREIRLKLYGGPRRESLLVLDVTYEQVDFAGVATKSIQGIVNLPVTASDEAVLKPDETHAVEVPLESLRTLDSDAPRNWVLGRVTVGAALRVHEARNADGSILVLQAIRFPQAGVLVFPAGFDLEAAARNPLNAVRAHLKDKLPQEAFMAAQLVRPGQKRAMAELLLGDDLDTDNLANQTARRRAMALLFDTGAAWDATKWRRWWEQNRHRY